jgi:uncharacterized protein YgiM (DUF1202 family)
MKQKFFLIFAAMLSTALLARQATNAPAPIETPAAAPAATNATAAPTNAPGTNASGKAEKKKAATKKKAEKKAVRKPDPAADLKIAPLVPGPAVVVASNVNVRGQAKLKSEIVTRVNKGQNLNVLEEVRLKNSGPDEPSAWAKILLPPGGHVWVNTSFINASNKTVLPRKLNGRSGAGENYSVIAVLKRGDSVKEVSTKGEWTEIEPPADAYAFVAARYLKQEPGATPELPPVATTVADAQPVLPPTTDTPKPPTDAPAVTNTPAPPTPPTTEPVIEEPPPKRIVQREGVVRGTFSIQAPTHFELVSPQTGRVINYLYTTSVSLDLHEYKGLRIVVTGEEGLDERWRNTPVITIQKIQVIE